MTELLIEIGCSIFEPHPNHLFSEPHHTPSPAGKVAKAGGHQSRQKLPDHGAGKYHRAASMPKRALWVHQAEGKRSEEMCTPCQPCCLQAPVRYQLQLPT